MDDISCNTQHAGQGSGGEPSCWSEESDTVDSGGLPKVNTVTSSEGKFPRLTQSASFFPAVQVGRHVDLATPSSSMWIFGLLLVLLTVFGLRLAGVMQLVL